MDKGLGQGHGEAMGMFAGSADEGVYLLDVFVGVGRNTEGVSDLASYAAFNCAHFLVDFAVRGLDTLEHASECIHGQSYLMAPVQVHSEMYS
jgi:hypothetical protein